ncbi:hypothetical protein [Edaphobacter dinghuensis]|uniref:Uncharacterized protein n=1 Tax=Edaphobacter dinghuensis TaxID=1560005 RepID=A0A917MAL2_9BACT|nr:hypothetical protein [Edaphobacter dinghuensis]GGG85505.1 hypothetical protein GCM10011585_31780 [Edaphobacter dinghuensis]
MRILFAISILCFIALIWAAVAITRRIRASHKFNNSSKPEFSQYLFDAAEERKSSLPHSSTAHVSSQDRTHSYDKLTSTERG